MLGLNNPLHIAFVLILVLLVFGAKRLPEMGKSLGSGLRGFKDSLNGEEPPGALTEARTETSVQAPSPVHAVDADRAEVTPLRPVAERRPIEPVA